MRTVDTYSYRPRGPIAFTQRLDPRSRLYAMYHRLALRRDPQIAVVAVARELVGYLWAVMRDLDASCDTATPVAA